jgi:hypothetical protein
MEDFRILDIAVVWTLALSKGSRHSVEEGVLNDLNVWGNGGWGGTPGVRVVEEEEGVLARREEKRRYEGCKLESRKDIPQKRAVPSVQQPLNP